MKTFFKPAGTIIDTDEQLKKSEPNNRKLYVAYVNKAMIDSDPMADDDNYYSGDSVKGYSASAFIVSDISYTGERIPAILSREDEMMLFDGNYVSS